jgi:hypothetical protein
MHHLLVPLVVVLSLSQPVGAQPEPVRPADLARLSVNDFRDDELDLPYYLANFHRVANSVALSGPRRGFIDIPVWRDKKDNQPYNARIMESILSLAFFYATDRPWNPYRGDPALRARLEAALDFWARSQSSDGRFSEYAPQQWSLAPTAFATKFMGEALRLLHDGPPIDTGIHRRAIDADRRAILAVLTRPDLYEHGLKFSNQIGNVWGGALAYLAMYPDIEIEAKLRARLKQTGTDHQSPAGYFYEADGPDWGYNLNTHHSDFHIAWHYARNTDLADVFLDGTRRWYEWLGYNAVPEPSGVALTLVRGIETRQKRAVVADAGAEESAAGFPIAERVAAAQILGPTREEIAQRVARQRAELARRWPSVDSLELGSFRAFSPYAFLHRSHVRWSPTDAQRAAAIAALRHQREEHFTHQRVDSRRPISFTYIRRPAYYAAFTGGDVQTAQQRLGLGLIWVPGAGSVLQSQTAGTTTAWGTRGTDTAIVYEASTFAPTFHVGNATVAPQSGNRDLPSGDVIITYALGTRGMKSVTFSDGGLRVDVKHAGAFVEQLPLLLLSSDSLETAKGVVTLRRGGTRVTVRWSPANLPAVERTAERSGDRRVVAISVSATNSLTYDITVRPGDAPK